MATNSPGQSIHIKSPRSPRQLPALPRLQQQVPIAEQRSPTLGQSLTKSPGTPLVFEFPPEYYPETPNTNFDFDEFGRAGELEQQRGPRSPRSPRSPSYYTRVTGPPRSPMTPNSEILHSPGHKSPIFQFCDPRKNLKQAASYPMSATSSSMIDRSRSVNSSCGYGQRSPKPFNRRRNSCFGLTSLKSPMSPTIVTPTSHNVTSPKADRSPDVDQKSVSRETVGYKSNDTGKSPSMEGSLGMHEKTAEETGERSKSIKMNGRFNKSQGCLDEVGREHREGSKERSRHRKGEKNMSRRSTSDLTDMGEADTEITMLSSPRRRGSMKGGLVPDHIRPRVHSLPEKAYNPRASDDLYRLRAFSITHKGVVNRGDSIISRRSRSNTSVNSSRNSNVSGERSPFEGSCCSGQDASTDSDIEETISKYRVILLGDSGVGKTALVSQFMTSEYINTYDASLDHHLYVVDDEFGEKTVSILLDGEESEMIFIDHPHVEMSVENSLSTYEPHACIVVYSIVSRTSFQVVEEILNYLWQEHYTQEHTVIVVGNKSDLVRSRTISANDGKQLATSRECKFIETSSGLKHNVDELLVGVLKQIRLRESREKKLRRQGSKGKLLSKLHNSKTVLSLNLAREILNKMCLNDSKSKSCENLHVL
ncbi:GTP-binding protein RAD [Formica fusca]